VPGSGARAGGPYAAGFVSNAWAKGLKLGVVASSDHYSTHQSYACVYAPRLKAAEIHRALKQRLAYASTDNIVVKFEAMRPDAPMGSEINTSVAPELRVEVQGTAPLARIELVRDGRVVLARQPASAADRFSFVDTDMPARAWYYVRAIQQNRHVAWSSPIWVQEGTTRAQRP
jgi:hypothetical protein